MTFTSNTFSTGSSIAAVTAVQLKYDHDYVMLWFRPLDNSTEGFQNWEFMTTHCWGEQAAGEWTLKIQDTPSQKRDGAEPGPLFLAAASQFFMKTCIEVRVERQCRPPGTDLFIFLSSFFGLFLSVPSQEH